MKQIAIDTSSTLCAVAIYDGEQDQVLAAQTKDIGRGHAEVLMGLMDACMREASIDYNALTTILVTKGPGSFTGVRVGLAAARGLGLSLGIPVNGISTLEACAQFTQATTGIMSVITLIDAKRGEAYFRLNEGDVGLAGYETLSDRISEDAVLAGSGAAIFNEISGRCQDIAYGEAFVPIEYLSSLKVPEQSASPEPLYLRSADAKPQEGFVLPRVVTDSTNRETS